MQTQREKVALFFDGIADMPRYRYPVQKTTVMCSTFAGGEAALTENVPKNRRAKRTENFATIFTYM